MHNEWHMKREGGGGGGTVNYTLIDHYYICACYSILQKMHFLE